MSHLFNVITVAEAYRYHFSTCLFIFCIRN